MSTQPTFASNPRLTDVATVSAANTNRDGTGTIVTVATGSAAGFKVNQVVTQPIVTTTAGMIRLYISTDTGTTWHLYDEIPVAAVTASGSVPAARNEVNYTSLVLFGTANLLGASTNNAEAHRVYALGADL
jgi:hypothetical protein